MHALMIFALSCMASVIVLAAAVWVNDTVERYFRRK